MNCGDAKPLGAPGGPAVDFAFLAAQTFGDRRLERELLDLFLVQARRQLSRVPTLNVLEQGEVAHLLKGSCQGIGAFEAASAAQMFEDADPDARAGPFAQMLTAFAAAESAIRAHLASF